MSRMSDPFEEQVRSDLKRKLERRLWTERPEPTLTEFLLARLAEDEAVARDKGADAMTGHRWKHAPENVYQELQSEVLANCRRLLAEVEAKRRIVELASEATGLDMQVDSEFAILPRDQVADPYCGDLILRALTAVYSDHADYRAEWAGLGARSAP